MLVCRCDSILVSALPEFKTSVTVSKYSFCGILCDPSGICHKLHGIGLAVLPWSHRLATQTEYYHPSEVRRLYNIWWTCTSYRMAIAITMSCQFLLYCLRITIVWRAIVGKLGLDLVLPSWYS